MGALSGRVEVNRSFVIETGLGPLAWLVLEESTDIVVTSPATIVMFRSRPCWFVTLPPRSQPVPLRRVICSKAEYRCKGHPASPLEPPCECRACWCYFPVSSQTPKQFFANTWWMLERTAGRKALVKGATVLLLQFRVERTFKLHGWRRKRPDLKRPDSKCLLFLRQKTYGEGIFPSQIFRLGRIQYLFFMI